MPATRATNVLEQEHRTIQKMAAAMSLAAGRLPHCQARWEHSRVKERTQ